MKYKVDELPVNIRAAIMKAGREQKRWGHLVYAADVKYWVHKIDALKIDMTDEIKLELAALLLSGKEND